MISFDTPKEVATYMQSLVPRWAKTILEPTPGNMNLISNCKNWLPEVEKIFTPANFFEWNQMRIDCVLMNPPFTHKETNFEGAPQHIKKLKGAKVGYWFLEQAMKLSDNVIALMPWYTIINSKCRTKLLLDFGLVSVTNISRSAFKCRIQVCVLQLQQGFKFETTFKQL